MTTKRTTPQFSPVHMHAIGVVGVFAMAGIGYAFGYAPSARAQHQAQLQRQAISKANDEANATAQHIEKATLELEILRAAIDAVPADADLVDVLSEAVADHTLAAYNVMADKTTAAEGVTRTTMVVHASGSFSDIARFIADLGSVHPGAAIDGFSIMPDPMGADTLVFQASLSVYAPQPARPDASAAESSGRAPAATPPDR